MDKTNYCKKVDHLSRCTLTDTKEQYKCKFFRKASESSLNPIQCRYYRPDLGDHCDNAEAQADARVVKTKEEEKPTPDFSY